MQNAFSPGAIRTTSSGRSAGAADHQADGLGQERAVEALRFGIGMKRHGYNVFAYGAHGTGKHALVRRELREAAAAMPVPPDWCYVHNFEESYRPKALRLPAGRGCRLRADMTRLIEELRSAIPAAFESEDYRARVQALQARFAERHETAFNALQERARTKNVALIRTPAGLALAPASKGEVVGPEAFRQWPEELQEKIKSDIAELEKELQKILRTLPQWESEQRRELRALNQEVASRAVSHLIEELVRKYEDLPEVLGYIDQVREDLLENAERFQTSEPRSPQEAMAQAMRGGPREESFGRYRVNVIVDNSDREGAPVVYEDLPTHANVIGRIEQVAQFGALTTDFNLIKPGALHTANGGFLLVDVRKLFMQPIIWEELKRALSSGEIRIQGLTDALGFATTRTLQPQPIPLDVKIVLLGDPMVCYLLSQADPEFPELFKVAADFDDRVPRDGGNTARYGQLIADIARRENLRPVSEHAAARVIERAARLAGDAERLTLRLRSISDLLCEADHWAGRSGNEEIGAEDVQQAIDAQDRRADRIRERSQEQILRDTMLIDTEGEAIGQVNGLSVLQLGEFAFGKPSRITAKVRLGRGEVLDIEREIELGGPLHSKGVLILSGFLGARFARRHPLALAASLVFEQSYGGVDGDSASSTELYALLSALSGLPIRQSLAVTGSVNQHGRIQAIGGVNEKIEGFFDICDARGLTGSHGVLIPASNVKHLMLRHDVVDAARQGRFHVYPVDTVDQGIELLTGVAAGEADEEGRFPPDTVNGRVAATLLQFAERARSLHRKRRCRRRETPVTPSGAEFGIRRIMVALDGSAHASGAPEAAAALAARLHAELEGVFVQDIDLARLAALPIGREIQFLTGRGRDFTADELDAHNLEQEACARRAIAAAAARACVGYAFRVARGQVRAEVLSAAGRADLLIVGIGSASPSGRARLGGTARAAAEHAPRSVMISKPGTRAIARPLVFHDGSVGAKRALRAAIRVFGAGERGLAVLIDSADAGRAEALRRDVESELAPAGVKHGFLSSAGPAPDQLCRLAAQAGADVLVIAADSRIIAGERRLQVLESIACPVLLVR